MNKPAMNIITHSVVMPHRGDRDWAQKVIQLAEARDRGVDAYNAYLREHNAETGSATFAVPV